LYAIFLIEYENKYENEQSSLTSLGCKWINVEILEHELLDGRGRELGVLGTKKFKGFVFFSKKIDGLGPASFSS